MLLAVEIQVVFICLEQTEVKIVTIEGNLLNLCNNVYLREVVIAENHFMSPFFPENIFRLQVKFILVKYYRRALKFKLRGV